ncbi:MAG: ADP-ribosylglycohydrolase family protein [Geothrix sp.]|nr:ADP-ribosylglycohydrolase family protein [Geothrix sp.]
MASSLTRADRIAGGIWGLLVGDALGVPYEFTPPKAIPPFDRIEMIPPRGFRRAHLGVEPGTWSDDGSQALCLLSSLLEQGRVDPGDLMNRLCRWLRDGYLAVDRDVFDVGLQTRRALERFLEGRPLLECAPRGEWSNGGGALMRVLPLALWHEGPDEDLIAEAMLQSSLTHGHVRSGLCCALYCLWARAVLSASRRPWTEAMDRLEARFPPGTPERLEYEARIHPRNPDPAKGTGHVVDTLLSAVQAVEAGSYESVVRAAIQFGNDTDTTACVAGGIAGLRDGVRAIPARWLNMLRGRDLVEPLLEAFLSRG